MINLPLLLKLFVQADGFEMSEAKCITSIPNNVPNANMNQFFNFNFRKFKKCSSKVFLIIGFSIKNYNFAYNKITNCKDNF